MKVLVTGGAGYIGSHTVLCLLQAGHDVTVVDNLCNARFEALKRVMELAGRPLTFREMDLRDAPALREVFRQESFDAVIHFAALKAVGESVREPLRYFHNNLVGSLTLFQEMEAAGVRDLVFSSSATVYGDPDRVPIPESAPRRAVNPYGRTKLAVEEMLEDIHRADPSWNILSLRYFNPVGAHESGRIGEDPLGIPNNLLPFVAQVAVGRLPELRVFGRDYPTPDGTGVRDYIHVMDLAEGHLAALDHLGKRPGWLAVNLGTGRGHSVLEVVEAFRRASGHPIPCRFVERRPGDAAICYADPSLARQVLGWEARRGLDAMCRDAWRWQSQNPRGYEAG
jgi:UDP-glucose 4-epimerase